MDSIIELKFFQIADVQYHNKKIKLRCIVTGKTYPEYKVPKIVEISYIDKETNKECVDECEILSNDNSILKFVGVESNRFKGVIRNILGWPSKADFAFEEKSMQNVERIFISASTGLERTINNSSVTAYYVGLGIEPNMTYEFEGYATNDPKTQEAVCIFIKATKLKSDAETFNLTAKLRNDLRIFRPEHETVDGIFEHLDGIYYYYSRNITNIRGRFDLHMALDLAFRSAINFEFNNEKVDKGWSDVMVIGDTECGKSQCARKLREYFDVGEMVNGEQTTMPGLAGGCEQVGNHWTVKFGKFAANDRGLLIVDEAGALGDDLWGNLSLIRSEGTIKIEKIKSSVANARTRAIYLTSPKNRTIPGFFYGIQALNGLMPAPDDIRRFDYVLIISSKEVDEKLINSTQSPMEPLFGSTSEISRQLDQKLLMWAWSRSPKQIDFSKEATKAALTLAGDLGKIYTDQIPLLQTATARIKIAKIALAFASRLYSCDPTGDVIRVKEVHIDCVRRFFDTIYDKEVSGYLDYSRLEHMKIDTVNKDEAHEVKKLLKSYHANLPALYNYLMTANSFDPGDWSIHMQVPLENARMQMGEFVKLNCLQRGSNNRYYKTVAFTNLLKRLVLRQEETL